MDIRDDPRRLQLAGLDGRQRRPLDHIDQSFASACQSIRTNKEVCPYGCGKLLAPRTIDYHRLNGCRGKQDDAFADVSRKRSFTCGACYEEFVTREAFFSHLNNEHLVEATIRSEVFPNEHTFERFRYWLEAQGGAHFRQKSGAKTRPSGKGIFMMCNRSGLVHTTAATGEPEKDKLGSYRMGFTCTAFINGTVYQDGHVSVRYCGDHYGHDARVRLPQSVKNLIMHMQQNEGRPNSTIIRYLQGHFGPFGHTSIHAQRAAFVDLEELRALSPMFRRLTQIPYEKEEEWEAEFLEMAGVVRNWAPPAPPRPADWLPIKALSEKLNWPPPIVYKARMRNTAGEWLVFDEERQLWTSEVQAAASAAEAAAAAAAPATTAKMKVEQHSQQHQQQHFTLDDLLEERYHPHRHQKGAHDDDDEGGEEEAEVDVEELRESKREEMPPVIASTSSAASPPPLVHPQRKKRRHDDSGVVRGGGEATMEEVDDCEGEERLDDEHEEGARRYGNVNYLATSIVAELEMLKALVKSEAVYLSEVELDAFLKQTRSLRTSFEPLPRNGSRASVGQMQREFAVPQLARPSRVAPMRRSRGGSIAHRTIELRPMIEMRSPFSPGPSWPASDAGVRRRMASSPMTASTSTQHLMMVDAHEIDVCDEEIVVGEGGRGDGAGGGAKIQFNARLWS